MMRTWSVQSAHFRIGFTALIILLLASGAGALSNSGGGSWWYYRDLTISNTGSDLTDYQVLVSLNSGNFPLNAQTNGADIRFTDPGGAELSYWIESWDYAGRNAKIWVNVTSIAASGSMTMRMWYGNPSASSSSNGDATFLLFDDFNDNSLNTNKWQSYSCGAGTVSENNGYLGLIPGGGHLDRPFLRSKNQLPKDIKVFADGMVKSAYGQWGLLIHWDGLGSGYYCGPDNGFQAYNGPYGADDFNYFRFIIKSSTNGDLNFIQLNSLTMDANWHKYTLSYYSNNLQGTYDSFSLSAADTTDFATTYIGFYGRELAVSSSIDNVRVVKYVSPEPSVSVGAEILTDPTGDIFSWSTGNPVYGPDYIDIVFTEISQVNLTYITLKIKVNGTIPSFGWQGYYFYIDTDRNSSTGFSNIGSNDIGVDYEIGVRGNSGSPPIFAEIRKDGVAQGSGIPITYTVSGDTISTTVSLTDIGNPTSFYWIALTTDGVSVNDKAPNTGHAIFSVSGVTPTELLSNSIGYSATVAIGQNTYVQFSSGSFGLLLKGQTKTINNSVILNNTGDISAKVEARFNDSVSGVFGLSSGANVLNATNFALGLPSSLMPLNNSGADVQVAVAPPGVTAMDARLGVPSEQVAGDYSGTVVLTFSNNV